MNRDLRERFEGRIFDFNSELAEKWAEVQGNAEIKGKPLSIICGFIAVTEIVNDLTLVTRNTNDMAASGVELQSLVICWL